MQESGGLEIPCDSALEEWARKKNRPSATNSQANRAPGPRDLQMGSSMPSISMEATEGHLDWKITAVEDRMEAKIEAAEKRILEAMERQSEQILSAISAINLQM